MHEHERWPDRRLHPAVGTAQALPGEAPMIVGILLALLLIAASAILFTRTGATAAPRRKFAAARPDCHTQWRIKPPPSEAHDGDWALMGWLLANGVRFHESIKIGWFTNAAYLDEHRRPLRLRGIQVTGPIERLDTLVTVPSGLALDHNSITCSVLGPVLDQHKQIPALAQAAIQLTYERSRGDDSFWGPYLDALPDPPPSLPFWAQVPDCLEGTVVRFAAEQLLEHRKSLWRDHVVPLMKRHPGLFDEAGFSEERFVWACGIISSRQHAGGMVPVIDLFNHRVGAGLVEASVLTQSHHKAAVALTSTSPPIDSQLFVDYGDRSNHELLLYFGFALEDNPYDHAIISQAHTLEVLRHVAPESPLHRPVEQTRAFLEEVTFRNSENRSPLAGDELRLYSDFVPSQVMTWLRGLASHQLLDSPEFRQKLSTGEPISAESELLAHKLLHHLCCDMVPTDSIRYDPMLPQPAPTRWGRIYLDGITRALQRTIARSEAAMAGSPSALSGCFLVPVPQVGQSAHPEATALDPISDLRGTANAMAHLALRFDETECVKALLNRKLIQLNSSMDYHGRSLLHQAAAYGSCRVLALLLAQDVPQMNQLAPPKGYVGAVVDRVAPLHICATATCQSVQSQRRTACLLYTSPSPRDS
eukprot:TRINITY_DN11643_c0_g1_i3.p1 TRINITY_DN11643_c0_g1~~TRINITY_DN11643_c0_g1_i3.p1  ORF type:complete len:646 (+),score=101.68 TRINITY_DN11643_c0_g1_i3:324-2261(+)